MRGRELQHEVIGLANRRGWMVASFPPVETKRGWRTSVGAQGRGFPDLLLLRDRLIVVEVKGQGDTLRDEQETWLLAFRLAGIETYVWRTADWESGLVDGILARRLGS